MTRAPLDLLLAALREHGLVPRASGRGYACRCPGHEDTNPSLSIAPGRDGRVLLNCHAGCSAAEVCGALGLRTRDLFADDRRRVMSDVGWRKPDVNRRAQTLHPPSATPRPTSSRFFPTARAAVQHLERRLGPRSCDWTYTDAGGEPVGLIVRWDGPGGKAIRPVSRVEGGWVHGGMAEPRPLYGLAELMSDGEERPRPSSHPPSNTVWVCEGEKAVAAARSMGLLATTSPHGALSAAKADWSPLAGRDVVILPDHDAQGERYAREVAGLAQGAGAASVRIVRLAGLWPDLPAGGDIADVLAQAYGRGVSGTLRTLVAALANAPAARPALRRHSRGACDWD